MQKVIYLDNAATSWPKPPEVGNAMTDFLTSVGGNPGRSGHRLSVEAARIVYDCRTQIADLLGVADPSRVVFLSNATHALNVCIRGLVKSGCRIVSTMIEHNSVARVLFQLITEGCDVEFCRCSQLGNLDIETFSNLLLKKTDFIVINHASNVTGTVQDIRTISRIAHDNGAIVVVDAAQTAGIVPINLDDMGIDVLTFTGHKGLFGPQGTGGLVFADGFDIKCFKPVFAGGTGSKSESTDMPDFLPDMLEAGTLNCPGIAGLSEGIRFVRKVGVGNIEKKEKELRFMLFSLLEEIPEVNVYGSKSNSTGVVSFTVDSCDNAVVGSRMDKDFEVMCRVGLQCAPLAHKTIGTFPFGTIRFSVSWFTQPLDISQAVQSLRQAIKR